MPFYSAILIAAVWFPADPMEAPPRRKVTIGWIEFNTFGPLKGKGSKQIIYWSLNGDVLAWQWWDGETVEVGHGHWWMDVRHRGIRVRVYSTFFAQTRTVFDREVNERKFLSLKGREGLFGDRRGKE